ncbi:MAG: LPS export ABC transporter periplasmic protein LptC [Bacteroidota bacterium]|nr:LPS export ABC transporter periplasmic protein LptC [Bacteroidota bacterium]
MKNSKNPSCPTIIIILLFALCSLLLLGCESKVKPPISSLGIGQDVPTQESWNAVITFTDSGRITAVLRAGHIAVFSEQKKTLMDSNITVDFFDENSNHTSTLTAKKGIVHDLTHDLEARENVIVVNDSGTTLRTEELYWMNKTQKIHTPAFVEITSPTEQIQGHGLESDQSLKYYTIPKVTGKAKTNAKK